MNRDDDEDSFLYGDPVPSVQKAQENVEVISVTAEAPEKQPNGVVAHLEAEAEGEAGIGTEPNAEAEEQEVPQNNDETTEEQMGGDEEGEGGEEEEEEGEEEEDSDEDIEFILEPPTRSLDFRSQRGGHRPTATRAPSAPQSSTPAPGANLTTEYTPRERGAPPSETLPRPLSQASLPVQTETPQILPSTPAINVSGTAQPTAVEQSPVVEGPDPSTLPPVRAPPSHPSIDPSTPGMYEGRSVFDIDMTNLTEKPWRRPGSDLSDWFNYGFDELSWEAYCYRRRAMGDMAGVLKANVMGFSGMPEEQLLALPPEARTMVMTGTHAMMSTGGGPNGPPGVGVGPGMMPPVGMNPMNPMGPMNSMMAAEMNGMGGMPPMMGGPMNMGMNGDMGVSMQGPGPGPGPMMQDGGPNGPVQILGQGPGNPGPSGTPEQGGQMNVPDGMMSMNMNMGPDFSMQMQEGGIPGQQMHPGMDTSSNAGTPAPVVAPPRVGSTPASFRGRGMAVAVPPVAPRGGRAVPTFPARGRGRGGMFDASSLPVRPASPLPPNVPTGPRNPGNRYKDRDNNAPAVEGLDYGGGNKEGVPSGEREREGEVEKEKEKEKEKSGRSTRDKAREKDRDRDREAEEKSSRKRRSPPSNEEDRMGRSSKRR